MSQQLINRSPDLKRLRDEGYDVEVRSGLLLLKDVPYVNERKEVHHGILVSELSLAGDVTTKPRTHVLDFVGEYPCRKDGTPITQIKNQSTRKQVAEGLTVDHTFSAKPDSGYKDYYDKMATHAAILSGPAQAIQPGITAKTFPVIQAERDESVFNYVDTASSRAEINIVSRRLELERIAIVGLGGTGSYVLDLVAKTPVREIHLFDGDTFLQHNAFRSPGAATLEELKKEPRKVAYYHARYSPMHRNIIPHDYHIDASTVEQLRGMAFVFLCIDGGKDKRLVVERIEEWGVPFIDVGMGVQIVDGALLGVLRVTSSTTVKRDHVRSKNRIPFADGDDNNEYARNIQIADLNALNACLAVVKWKKLSGFYLDLEREHFSTYTIDGNTLINEDQA